MATLTAAALRHFYWFSDIIFAAWLPLAGQFFSRTLTNNENMAIMIQIMHGHSKMVYCIVIESCNYIILFLIGNGGIELHIFHNVALFERRRGLVK